METKRLAGKVAIITGSTGEMGEVMAAKMAKEGASVVISGRNESVGKVITNGILDSGGKSHFIKADVSIPEDCHRLIDESINHFGKVDILINNAAHLGEFDFEKLQPQEWDSVFATNIRGPMLCCQRIIPHFKRQRSGCIINIGTTTIYKAASSQMERLAYVSSKGALLTFTKHMARSLASDQIRSNWITVGWVATRGELSLRKTTSEDIENEFASRLPMGRLEKPEEIASGVIYLASDEATHVTGCELNISGAMWV